MGHILIVEDDFKIRDIIKTYLSAYSHTFIEAKTGREGLDQWSQGRFDAVLLDVMMPEMDGWTVLREIRSQSSVPVILLTARDQERDKLFGFELGVDDYLVKPFSPKELMARLGVALRRSGVQAAIKQVEIGPLALDIEGRLVWLGGVSVKLTPKEYDLLVFLIQNPKRALARQQILDAVWGRDFFGDDRTVDTHVKVLRESLGPYKTCIATVWGVGYRFEPEILEVKTHESL